MANNERPRITINRELVIDILAGGEISQLAHLTLQEQESQIAAIRSYIRRVIRKFWFEMNSRDAMDRIIFINKCACTVSELCLYSQLSEFQNIMNINLDQLRETMMFCIFGNIFIEDFFDTITTKVEQEMAHLRRRHDQMVAALNATIQQLRERLQTSGRRHEQIVARLTSTITQLRTQTDGTSDVSSTN